jgi:cellulose synthase (UDP-forming)
MKKIENGSVPNMLLLLNSIVAIIYISWWFSFNHILNIYIYSLLFFGEIYHVIMALGFWFTIWQRKRNDYIVSLKNNESVIIFITVAGEPVDVVEETVRAAKEIDYSNFKVCILNDGYLAKKDNWEEIEKLAKRLGVRSITRKSGSGAKAGNINNGLKQTSSDFIVILDADMVPNKDFLSKLMPYFKDDKVAFVQSPQYYKNQNKNEITQGSWEQQNFFFGPIMRGKNNLNSAFLCGTNVVIRRKAIEEVGGINEKSIAEDFLTSFYLHKKKWKSIYYPNVLCEGLAPEDLLSYYKQQHRWARGSLEILFRYNPFFRFGFTLPQRIQYFLSSLYYFNGLIVLIDIITPLLFLYFGIQPVSTSTQIFALFFIPYMFLNLYTLYLISNGSITFRAISFSQSSFFLQLSALFSLITGRDTKFEVTSKRQRQGKFIFLVYPHLIYTILALIGIGINFSKFGTSPAVTTNSAWAIFNVIMFLPFIKAAFKPNSSEENVNIEEAKVLLKGA